MFCNNCGNQLQSYNKFCPRCGAPATAETQPQPPQQPSQPFSQPFQSQPQPAYFQPAASYGDGPRAPAKKGGCGKILLILSIVLLLLGGGIAAAVYYGYHYAQKAIKSSEAYTVALAALKQNPQVQEKMGDIKDTGFPLGSFKEDADGTGAAAYRMSVEGTKASGNYNVMMRRQNRKWRLITGSVTLNSGETIEIANAQQSLFGDDDNSNAGLGSNSNSRVPVPPTPPGSFKTPADAVSGGVLNGKAIDMPKPSYPPTAKAVHASGAVTVQVLVDEDGEVIAAQATSGHPLLRASAVAAARQAKFAPTMIAGHPAKVSGVLVYNFEAQ